MQNRAGVLYGTFEPPTLFQRACIQEAVRSLQLESLCFRFLPSDETEESSQTSTADFYEMLRLAFFGIVPLNDAKPHCHLFMEPELSPSAFQKLFPDSFPKEDSLVLFSEKNNPENKELRLFLEEKQIPRTILPVEAPYRVSLPQVQEYIQEMGLYGCTPSPEQAREIYPKLLKKLPAKRFFHSILVAATARQLAEKHGVNPAEAALAGLIHDCAKALALEEMQAIARSASLPVDDATFENENLLHGPVGSVVAKEEYGIQNENILSAVFCHTTGKPGMTPLDMILFLADKIEPSRRPYPRLETIRRLAQESLEEAMLESLMSTLSYVSATQSEPPHPMTYQVYEWIKTKTERK